MSSKIIFFLLLGLDALILLLETAHVSISYNEALLLYGNKSFLQEIIKFFIAIFGKNDIGLRFAMILFHLGSVVLLYNISKKYLKSSRNRLWLIFIFILLPGVISAALVVNHAGMLIFGLLLYIYLSDRFQDIYTAPLLLFFALIDSGFSYLFLGLMIYYFFEKKRWQFLYNILLYLISASIYNIKIYGSPSGHFLDIMGVYSAIFTPIVFIYIFYVLYKRFLTKKIDKIWYISTTALLISLILSFRQRVDIEAFAPYLIISLPLAAQSFVSSYRVRVKEFRKKYKIIFVLSLLFLLLNAVIVFFNKELYRVLDNPKKHFAYNMHVAKELAIYLKRHNIDCVQTDSKMQLRLKFYGVAKCDNVTLDELSLKQGEDADVTIRYNNRVVYKANVTNINNK
ncbi:FIG00761799: membrane protein [hydrothermal vent metagenome]|uniref:FIG00761799: membrane protein n=1 Tax=hydrothermal vent metagenome TaxID=652676 RepID=A0A1W1BB79_9ZZZZ